MKKIAFLASGHAGSTMPLIKVLLDRGYTVDYYILCNKEVRDIEACDCNYKPIHRGVEEISPEHWNKLYHNYIGSDRFKIFAISTFRPFENNICLNRIIGIARLWQIRKACEFINSENYCLVNFIGRYKVSDIARYGKYVKSEFVVSLHEVCNHLCPDYEHPNSVIRYLFENRIPVVLFSDKSKEDLQKYKGSENAVIFRENFGKFESFKIFQGGKRLELPDNYVLFIGRITPYKGLGLFFEATKDLARNGRKFVIAGNGYDEALADIGNYPNYRIINRYLAADDFVELVERCMFVVCPYISMSQSGIPQSVFVFNKPVIATDLSGFREVIKDNVNGILVPVNNSDKLSDSIEFLIKNQDYRNNLINGVKHFEEFFPLYSWNEIAVKYERDFIKCQD